MFRPPSLWSLVRAAQADKTTVLWAEEISSGLCHCHRGDDKTVREQGRHTLTSSSPAL